MFLCLLANACSPNQRIVNSAAGHANANGASNSSVSQAGTLERDIEAMRTADFIFIYVFRRKDGAPLDADDKRFAGQVIPQEMNRRSLSDEGRAIVVGSNFRMPEENLTMLTERFAFEDLSRPEAAANTAPPQPVR